MDWALEELLSGLQAQKISQIAWHRQRVQKHVYFQNVLFALKVLKGST